ncbi:MAG: N-acetyl-gamma-glutamyl-phosphate reductase [Bacteroidales bacterium]|jgi:N-acetyl-gamma-glutamyl-phosphate reductase|nr:N-acetyl-gamma-glutamyl-phosphate reductase [Bacteroidales bacterium]
MIKAGIIGGAGYTGGELVRILLHHPEVEISYIHSNSHAGKPIYEAHSDLFGDTDMVFTGEIGDADVIFLCLGHGKSLEFLNNTSFERHPKIIDLSQDFRINQFFQTKDDQCWEFVYGLPECSRPQIQEAGFIANPGCFATAFELALLPLAKSGLLTNEVQVNGITGSTGAGQAATSTTHFSWRNNNISIYKPFTHQHLKEVRKTLEITAGNVIPELNFLPLRGDFTRGIFLSAYMQTEMELPELIRLYKGYYADAAFTFVSDHDISLKEVVNTNKCLLHIEKYNNKVLITSVIDNLLKGASGQAVQNMNLMFGLDEKTGLALKASVF